MKKISIIILVCLFCSLLSGCLTVDSLMKLDDYYPMGEDIGDGKFYVKTDQYRDISFITNSDFYLLNFYPYIAKPKNGSAVVRLYAGYYGSNWVFFNKFIVMNDALEKFSVANISTFDKEGTVKSGYVEEVYDFVMTKEQIAQFKKVLSGTNIKIAFYGDAKSHVENINNEQARSMIAILDYASKT